MEAAFIGQIMPWAGKDIPDGWMVCEGQILSINTNSALFSLLGTTYGGDGRTSFALPDLRGRFPIGEGSGPGLVNHELGQSSGIDIVYLNEQQIPPHTHSNEKQDMRNNIPFTVSSSAATETNPKDNYLARAEQNLYSTDAASATEETGRTPVSVNVHSQNVFPNGGSQAHNNMQPFLTIRFIIAIMGEYPSRS